MRKIIAQVKAALEFIRTGPKEITALQKQVNSLELTLKARTELHADVGIRGDTYAILIGRYHGVDYVETFALRETDLGDLVPQMRSLQRYATLRRVDCPPQFRSTVRSAFK